MRTYLDCIPCLFRQAIEVSKLAGASEKDQKKIVDELSSQIPKFSLNSSPPEITRIIFKILKKIGYDSDPYKKIKEKSNRIALALYPKLKKKLAKTNDKLLTALELAIVGNIIDYGVGNVFNVENEIKKIFKHKHIKNKGTFNYSEFKYELKKASSIIYLADNAGEVVFDKILIEEIKKIDENKRIFYVVKEQPVINDALIEDAYKCGIDKVSDVISCGVDAPGVVLSLCSSRFLNLYKTSDLVISKGQGNFEAFSDKRKKIFYLFITKCAVVAMHAKCNIGDINLFYNQK